MPTASEHAAPRRRWWRWPVRLGLAWLLLALVARPLLSLELGAIHAYRGHKQWRAEHTHCLFRPSCSHYALGVLERDGFWTGNARVCLRLLMCSPLAYAMGEPNQDRPAPFDAWAPAPAVEPRQPEVSSQPPANMANSAATQAAQP